MRSLLIKIIALFICISASPAFAGFSTYTTNWPNDAATVDEKISKPQTNEVTTDTVYTDETDKDTYTPNERIDDYKRLYAKIGMTFLTAQLRNINNTSQSSLAGATLVNNGAQANYLSWEVGLGTAFKFVRMEIEYLYEKKMSYNASPLFVGLPEALVSEFNSQALWLWALYDFKKLSIPYFIPYIGGCAGFVWNKTRTTMSGGIGSGLAQNHVRYSIGWGVMLGAKVPFWTRWFGYFGYKYMAQGMARYQSYNANLGLKAQSVVQGVDVGVMYLLG